MRTLLFLAALAFFAAYLWQVTHCPVSGGLCSCSSSPKVLCMLGIVVCGVLHAAACYRDRRLTPWS